ncbi:MAG: spore germination protein [Clostridia bacterium]|nr:spore germination protein [Clostridia bacterium]
MQSRLTEDYNQNVDIFAKRLRVAESFDILQKTVSIGNGELTLFFIDGFTKDTNLQKLIMHFISVGSVEGDARQYMIKNIPYIETDVLESVDAAVTAVLSGCTLVLGSSFGAQVISVDLRTYPARSTEEPEGDRVMRGSRDGFVETLIFNTALIRRRIRTPSLTMQYFSIGNDSKTDVVMCYMSDRADKAYVAELEKKLKEIKTDSLVIGHESLKECLIKTRWYNPFPKIRTTERPDTSSAQLLEGSVLIVIDNSPEVMILPVSIFDFMQESNDFYFPPMTGTYIRLLRYIVFFFTLIITPAWYLMTRYPELVPSFLQFAMPEDPGKLPIIVQLLLAEFIIDALRLASLNTPSMLNNSLSVVGGLILGDFAVEIGWLIPEVILYMAFVAIANFTQRSYELGYAIKFLRIFLLIATGIFGFWGFCAGFVIVLVLTATNSTVNGKRNYLYPLIPFDAKALLSLVVRVKKKTDN